MTSHADHAPAPDQRRIVASWRVSPAWVGSRTGRRSRARDSASGQGGSSGSAGRASAGLGQGAPVAAALHSRTRLDPRRTLLCFQASMYAAIVIVRSAVTK